MKVVIAGGRGMLGHALGRSLAADGAEVVALSRSTVSSLADGVRVVRWDGRSIERAWTDELAAADALVDLCGLSVGTWPWTARTRARLRSSRLEPRTALVDAIRRLPEDARPATFLGISGTDGYVGADEAPATEDQPLASTFLGQLCHDWEVVAEPLDPLGVRRVIARSSLVVARGAPALARLALPVRLFLGGRIGSGRQWFSWIHIDDWVSAVRSLLRDRTITGPINLAAPLPLRQAEVAETLAQVLHRPSSLPTPAFAVRLLLGGQADLVLGSRRVSCARLVAAGATFRYPDFASAVREALG